MNKILCSAIHIDDSQEYVHQPKNIKTGLVVCGRRHCNCFSIIKVMYQDCVSKLSYNILCKDRRVIQGFLTTDDKFLDRYEAYKVAKSAGQLDKDLIGSQLTSEDLW